jgi:LysR family transcriptional regulator, carnitine catabolism transcriptional activator
MFLAVVDEGTFTKAAATVYVSQSALSQAIQELERDVGVALFHRVGRRVVLTAAGAALVEPARQALRDLANARAAVAAVSGLEAGRLDLVALPTLAVTPVAPLIGAFRRAHPAVSVQLRDPDDPDDLVRAIRSGTAEVGVTDEPTAPTGLVEHRLASQRLVAVFPPGTAPPAAPVALRDLRDYPMIATPPGTSSRRILDEAFRRVRHTPDIAVETEQREAILPLVLEGAGVALLPAAIAETATARGVHVVDCRPELVRRIVLVHRDAALSPAAAQFRAFALPH